MKVLLAGLPADPGIQRSHAEYLIRRSELPVLLLLSIVAHIEQVARTDIGDSGPIRVTDCVYDKNGPKNGLKVP